MYDWRWRSKKCPSYGSHTVFFGPVTYILTQSLEIFKVHLLKRVLGLLGIQLSVCVLMGEPSYATMTFDLGKQNTHH